MRNYSECRQSKRDRKYESEDKRFKDRIERSNIHLLRFLKGESYKN